MIQKIINECMLALDKRSFNFSDAILLYNPMEEFVKNLKEKETAHSNILAELLKEDGKHGLGSIFINSFLKRFLEIDSNNISNVKVNRERPVKRIITEGSKRFIDIFIEYSFNGDQAAIIIENKLNNADYQYKQIEDYYQAIDSEGYKNISVLCLHNKRKNTDCDLKIKDSIKPKIIYPLVLSEWLEYCLEQCDRFNRYGRITIYAYQVMLKNLNTDNIMMTNGKILLDLDESIFKNIKNIVDAYKYVEENRFFIIEEELKIRMPDLEFHTEKDFLHIWNTVIFEEYGCKLAVSIYTEKFDKDAKNENFLSIYTVEEDNNDREKELMSHLEYKWDKSGVKKGAAGWKIPCGDKWYESEDRKNRIFDYPNPKGFKDLIEKIVNIFEQINSFRNKKQTVNEGKS